MQWKQLMMQYIILTGMDTGDRNEKGEYALGSFNGKVDTQLKSFNWVKQAFMQTDKTAD